MTLTVLNVLINFEVGPLRTHTLAPSILPLLEAKAEGFFWNLPEFGRRIRFDVFHGCETSPLEAHFLSMEQPEVTRSEIRSVRWLRNDRNACAMQFGRKRRDKWQGEWQREWCLHHGNAPSHTSLVVQQFLAERSIPVITQPPYSPDHAPTNFWLFPTRKMGHKRDAFPNNGENQIECDNRTPEDSKRSPPPVLPTMPGSMEHLCVCPKVLL